ncbi:MAG: hypothetical protein AABX35_00385 [Nanoarchaeota archaeon]
MVEANVREFYSRRYNWEFQGPFYKVKDLPEVFDESLAWARPCIDALREYLTETFVVSDHFSDHRERRDFWRGNHPDYDPLIDVVDPARSARNLTKNRANVLGRICSSMEYVADRLKSENKLPKALESFETHPMGYDRFTDMDLDQKVTFSRRVDERAYSFLIALSE